MQPRIIVLLLGAALILLLPYLGCSSRGIPAANRFDETFWKTWSDGKAELNVYTLQIERYGQARNGTAVTIFVTEPFSKTTKLKADHERHRPQDVIQVLKLNLITDFPTGIYDYNLMTSSFAALADLAARPAGSPLKISFSAQEWCGHTFHQLLFDDDKIHEHIHSYFDSEGDQEQTLRYPEKGISEDLLLHWARGFAPPYLGPGESAEVQMLMPLSEARLLHKPLSWRPAVLRRGAAPEQVQLAGKMLQAERWEAIVEGGAHWIFLVEATPFGKILSWETSTGIKAELAGSTRLPYWKLNTSDVPSLFEQLGVSRDMASGAPLK